MRPTDYSLEIRQGGNYSITFTINRTGFDFTGYASRAKIRSGFAPDSATVVTFSCQTTSAIANTMVIVMTLTAAQTAAIVGPPDIWTRKVKVGYWDLEIYKDANVECPLDGQVTLRRQATVE